MKKHLMKCFALALMAGALVQTVHASHVAVGGSITETDSTSYNSRVGNATPVEYWVGKCHLNPEDDPVAKFAEATPLEAEYVIGSSPLAPSFTLNIKGTGFSTNGIVRLLTSYVAQFNVTNNFASGDCIYIVERTSVNPVLSGLITEMEWSDNAYTKGNWPTGEDVDHLRGGRFWYMTDIVNQTGLVGNNSRKDFVVLYVNTKILGDHLWQCRIGDVGYKTLEEALDAAKADDTIYLKRDLNLTNNVTIAKDVTITTELGGKVAVRRLDDAAFDIAANVVLTNVTVNGLGFSASRPMLNVADGATLTLATDVTVNSCVNTNGNGGAIASSGTVVLNGARIVSSSASGWGGAIYAAGGVVDARAGEITGCSAAQGGGAAYLDEGASMALAGTFRATDNTAGVAANNVQPTGATQLAAAADFAGLVGVSYPVAGTLAGGAQFGVVADAANVAARFRSDVSPDVFSAAVESDGRLVWKETSWNTPVPVVMTPAAPESLVVVGAETKMVEGDGVLIFTNTAAIGSFTIPSNTYARILCVGGGAAGGTVGLGVAKGAGGGGGAGGFYEMEAVLKPGTYQVAVGAGAARVDSYVQSWVGNNGGASWIVKEPEVGEPEIAGYVISVKGGGGGGAPKPNGLAVEGGSGGGGSWWGNRALAGGVATDGYGWKGAHPAEESVGGGGGGAAMAAIDGKGKPTGEGGNGRVSDITGEAVAYAVGGCGGRRLDPAYEPQDGATPGSGGDGAGAPGKGGAGADGIVVVRLAKAFMPVKVPYPSYSVGVPFAPGETVSPFGDGLADATNRFFIADIAGELEVACAAPAVGMGRHSFTVTLKDGYVWDDGSAVGATAPKTFFWRVKDPNVEGHAAAEVTKTVSWSDGSSNAVISIEAHTSPELVTTPPKVLVIGTLCDAHLLTPQTVKTCLDTAAEVADVEYYFYSNVTESEKLIPYNLDEEYWEGFWASFWESKDSLTDDDKKEAFQRQWSVWDEREADGSYYWENFWRTYQLYKSLTPKNWESLWENSLYHRYLGLTRELEDVEPLIEGELAKGAAFTDLAGLTASFGHPQHKTLYGFYERLVKLIDAGKTYDYIILCFDRSHVADDFPGSHPREADVAAFLKPLYADGRVIWLLDNESPGLTDNEPMFWATPWRPGQFKCNTPSNGNIYWTTHYSSFFATAYQWTVEEYVQANRVKAWTIHKALFGMFDPEAYDSLDQQAFYDNLIGDLSAFTPEQVAATSGKANPNQVVYDDAGMVGDLVRRIVKPIRYTMILEDAVNVDEGLELDDVSGLWTANAELDGWQDLVVGENLFPTNNGAAVKISGVDSDIWIKLDLLVHDKGQFRTSVNATYNPRTGLWEKDPNDGPVMVQTTTDGSEVVTAEDMAATEVGWTFLGFELTGSVESNTNGLNTGDIVVNGYSTNWVAVGVNTSPQTVFRAAPGYILDRLVVDGEDVDFDIMTCERTFDYVNADHDVKVWYRPYFVVNPPPETGPVTNVYDGTGYAPTVTNVCFSEDIPYPWYPVYSFESNGVYSAECGQTNVVYDADGNITSTNLYVRIAVLQPGYEEPVILDNWTGVNEVTILPREVTIEFDGYAQTNDVRKTGDFAWTHVGGELMDGDEIVVPSSVCTNYPAKGEYTVGSITSETAMVVDAEGNESGNYVVRVIPGNYYWPERNPFVEAKGVTVVYDGQDYGITVKAFPPQNPPTAEEMHALYGNSGLYTYISEPELVGAIIRYSVDGGETYPFTEPPTYTDVGTNTVHCMVTYEYRFLHGKKANSPTGTITQPYSDYAFADVVILPRPVYVTADSDEKFYDGEPLVDGGYTVAPPTDVTGFVEGEGATFHMTDDSTITNPGSTANRIDPSDVQPHPNTELDNYEFHYFDGTLTVRDRLLSVPTGVEKIYDGDPVGIGVTVATTTSPDTPLEPGEYTIRYSLDPDDPNSWVEDLSFVNVGVSNKVYYVVEAKGYEPQIGYEYVTIWPREIVVTADDKSKWYGEDDPELTWTISAGTNEDGVVTGVLAGEEDLVAAAVASDPRHSISREGAGTEDGEKVTSETNPPYPITPSGSEYLGNYHVTYVEGELTIKDKVLTDPDPAEKIYDGIPTNITVTVTTTSDDDPLDPDDYTITYFYDPTNPQDPSGIPPDADWNPDLDFTDATPGTNTVWYVVEVPGYNPVTNKSWVVIDRRPVVITADSDEKTYDGTPLTDGGYTVAPPTATTGFLDGEGVSVIAMTADSTITDPGSTKNVIDPTKTRPNEKTKLSNYEIRYIDGTLTVTYRHHEAEPLIAEFTLSADNGSLQTMRIWTTDTIESGDLVYICAAKTYEDAKTNNWVALTDSECLVDDLVFDAEHIAPYRDIVFTGAEAAAGYRFFRPYILTPYGEVCPGRKYVGIVDVEMDPYGETAAGVPFARCLSTTPFEELAAYYDPDIPVTELVQTNTLRGSANDFVSDKLFILPDGTNVAFDWYSLDERGNWIGFADEDGDFPPEAKDILLPRGTAFNIKREGNCITGTIRLHGQIDEEQASWTVVRNGITLMSSGVPEDLDLNDAAAGIVPAGPSTITYMDESDFTYIINYGDPDDSGANRWYRTKTVIKKGKRETQFVDPPLIPSGRVFWFTDGTTDNPAIPVGK